MTLRIFKESGEKVERIERVMKVVNHSAVTGNGGYVLDIHVFNPDYSFEQRRIQLGEWDFYTVEA